MKKKVALIFLITLSSTFLYAQGTIHLICPIDRYSNIAESCDIDFKNISKSFKGISNDIGMSIKVYDIGFTKKKNEEFGQFIPDISNVADSPGSQGVNDFTDDIYQILK